MLVDTRGHPLLPKIAHNHPEFERAKAPAKRSSIVHQIRNIVPSALCVTQVFRNEAKSSFYHFGLSRVEDAAIDRCKEPFMWINNQGVRAFAASENPLHRWINSG